MAVEDVTPGVLPPIDSAFPSMTESERQKRDFLARCANAFDAGLCTPERLRLLDKWIDAVMRFEGGQTAYFADFIEAESQRTNHFHYAHVLAGDVEGVRARTTRGDPDASVSDVRDRSEGVVDAGRVLRSQEGCRAADGRGGVRETREGWRGAASPGIARTGKTKRRRRLKHREYGMCFDGLVECDECDECDHCRCHSVHRTTTPTCPHPCPYPSEHHAFIARGKS
jgi:hypothetical protein